MRKSPIKRYARLASSGRPKAKPRKASEFARIYGSKARVAWVNSLPCICSRFRCVGQMQNAHVVNINGGMSRKSDAEAIAPMCMMHHGELHLSGPATFEARYGVDLRAEAARIQTLWEARCRD